MASSKHISIGRLGEDIAAGYLSNRGFTIQARNYRKKWGELDIIAYREHVLHFVEVKAGTWNGHLPREGVEGYRPEDHMTKQKLARLGRALQSYLAEYPLASDEQWTLDLLVVLLDDVSHRARVELVPNILI